MKKQFAKLIDLKSILTILVVLAMIFGYITNRFSEELFASIVTMILTYYFTRKNKHD